VAISGTIKRLAKADEFNFSEYVKRISAHSFIIVTESDNIRADFTLAENKPIALLDLGNLDKTEQCKCEADGFFTWQTNGDWIDINYKIWISKRYEKRRYHMFLISAICSSVLYGFLMLMNLDNEVFVYTILMIMLATLIGLYIATTRYGRKKMADDEGLENHIDNLEYHLEEKDRGWLE